MSPILTIIMIGHGNHISVWSPGCRPGVKHVEEVRHQQQAAHNDSPSGQSHPVQAAARIIPVMQHVTENQQIIRFILRDSSQ